MVDDRLLDFDWMNEVKFFFNFLFCAKGENNVNQRFVIIVNRLYCVYGSNVNLYGFWVLVEWVDRQPKPIGSSIAKGARNVNPCLWV